MVNKRDFPLLIEGFVIYNQYKLHLFLCKVLHIQKTVVYLLKKFNQ